MPLERARGRGARRGIPVPGNRRLHRIDKSFRVLDLLAQVPRLGRPAGVPREQLLPPERVSPLPL